MRREIIFRGANNEERLFLQDLNFCYNGKEIKVLKTSVVSPFEMTDLIVRHKARYALVQLFCRPTFRVLDFPCGSGYASKMLESCNIIYEGKDIDPITIEYAKRIYQNQKVNFETGNLKKPNLKSKYYNVIGCIEGLEHIECKYQAPLIEGFYKALISNGVLIISSPENRSGKSGLNLNNKYHLCELIKDDFVSLLIKYFPKENVELITQKNKLHTGDIHNCFYAVCHKE